MCFPGMRVSRTHIPRDACFPAHISLGMRVSHTYIEWVIHYRTYFEVSYNKSRHRIEINIHTVYFKGMKVANLHGEYR